jgi:hypothetical protein
MCSFLEGLKDCDILEKCGSLDDEVVVTKKNLLLGGLAAVMTGVVIGMLTAMKHRPPMPPEGKKKKHCIFSRKFL